MNLKALLMGAAIAAAMAAAAPASATTIYQSIPDLTIAPYNSWCSTCSSYTQYIGQQFSLSGAATANSVSFAVASSYYWPTSVTVGIYGDNGGAVGSAVYNATFSSFASDVATANDTDIVTVDIGSVALAPGQYVLFMTNPSNLGIPAYTSGSGQVYTFDSVAPGVSYGYVGAASAVSISGVAPEPSTWAMMGLGFAGLAFAGYRSRRPAAQRA